MTAPDTPARWTVDDDDGGGTYPEIVYNGQRLWEWLCENATTAPDCLVYEGWAALVADVRAARVHEGCAPAADTLRQAPTADVHGCTYETAYKMSQALGLTETQFYGLLHGAVLRTDDQVAEWDLVDGGTDG